MADELKDLTINSYKYYESGTATASDTQSDPTIDTKTVTHIINGKGKLTDTRNRNSEQKLLSNKTLPVIILTMNPDIDPIIVPIVVVL